MLRSPSIPPSVAVAQAMDGGSQTLCRIALRSKRRWGDHILDVFFVRARGTASKPPWTCFGSCSSPPPSTGTTTSSETGRDDDARAGASLGRRRGFQITGEGWSTLGEPFVPGVWEVLWEILWEAL